jgi:type I restriction enzyme, S subunit
MEDILEENGREMELPSSWAQPSFIDIFESISANGKKIKQRDYQSSGLLPVIDQGEEFIGGYTNEVDAAIKVDEPLIVFGDHTRAFKFIRHDFAPGADGIKILRASQSLLPKFAYFACLALRLPNRGYSRHYSILKKLSFPVAPLNEQHRIVEKIETLFARLNKGEETLREVQKLLARYRQSVLKAAVTGHLTADWRTENAHRLEHGRNLLARILQTRRETWEGRGKYKEPTVPDTNGLPELPEGWVWATVGAFGDVKGGKRLPKGHSYSQTPTQHPYIRVTDFDGYGVNQSKLKYLLPKTAATISRYTIANDDTYISIAGTIGVVGVIPPELSGANLTENAAKISNLVDMFPKFLVYWLNSPEGSHEIKKRTIATTQPKLALFRIADIPTPVVPIAEQMVIVDCLDEIFSRTKKLEEWCETELTRSTALRQSILKDAFAGRLVPQDPNDEPASELLARIRAERAAGPKSRYKAGRSRA